MATLDDMLYFLEALVDEWTERYQKGEEPYTAANKVRDMDVMVSSRQSSWEIGEYLLAEIDRQGRLSELKRIVDHPPTDPPYSLDSLTMEFGPSSISD